MIPEMGKSTAKSQRVARRREESDKEFLSRCRVRIDNPDRPIALRQPDGSIRRYTEIPMDSYEAAVAINCGAAAALKLLNAKGAA